MERPAMALRCGWFWTGMWLSRPGRDSSERPSVDAPVEFDAADDLEGRQDFQGADVDMPRRADGIVDGVGDVARLQRFVAVEEVLLGLLHIAGQPAEDLRLHPPGTDFGDPYPPA